MPASTGPAHFEVELAPLPGFDALRDAWTALQRESDCSYFVSWHWIGAWLREICDLPKARLLSIHRRGRTIALGVITERRRFRGLGPLTLRLHEVGNQALDDITIEYNGLLAQRGRDHDALQAAVRHLAAHDRRWLTLYFPGVDLDAIDPERLRHDGQETRMRVRATHRVDLDAVRASGGSYIDSLSSSARSRVRVTTRRLAERHGPLRLETAAAGEREAYFRELVALHRVHWARKDPAGGAFEEPRIMRFHDALLATGTAEEGPSFVRLRAGDAIVGYLYQIEWRGTVYYYQAGIDYAAFPDRGSPGLVLLAHAVQDACDRGMHRYEFMAGDADYKRRLGNAEGRMAWLSIDRINLASRARHVWWSLRRGRTA